MASKVQITLHWLDRSRAQRIIWLLEELRLPYNLKTYQRKADQQAPSSLKAVHPLGKSPVLELIHPRTQKPLVLAESANIIEYLAEHFGRHLIPQQWKGDEREVGDETDEWMRYKFYMNYAEGSLMNLIGTGALRNGALRLSLLLLILLLYVNFWELMDNSDKKRSSAVLHQAYNGPHCRTARIRLLKP